MFTYQYHQPTDYQFSLDSIYFAEFLAQYLKERSDLASLRLLDLCAGCGVIGLELSFYLREITQIDFMEVQTCYTEHFQKNVVLVNRPELTLRWHAENYDVLLEKNWSKTFDVIISNPPYFHREQGMLSPSQFKNRCRFFIDSTFTNFILGMLNALTQKGEAYFLLRSLKQHGFDALNTITEILKPYPASIEVISTLRKVDIIKLTCLQ